MIQIQKQVKDNKIFINIDKLKTLYIKSETFDALLKFA